MLAVMASEASNPSLRLREMDCFVHPPACGGGGESATRLSLAMTEVPHVPDRPHLRCLLCVPGRLPGGGDDRGWRGAVSGIQRSRQAARSIRIAINVVLGFGFIFLSGFALLPALVVVLITEAFYVRSVLAYAVGGAGRRRGLLSRTCSVRSGDMKFDGIVRRHLEIMTGAGIVAGLVYWMIAGRSRRRLARTAASFGPPPPLPSHSRPSVT